MSLQSTIITIPDMRLTLEQLLLGVRQLNASARLQVAQVLLETPLEAKMNAKLTALIEQLENTVPADDAEIMVEINIVRQLNSVSC